MFLGALECTGDTCVQTHTEHARAHTHTWVWGHTCSSSQLGGCVRVPLTKVLLSRSSQYGA